ncbi:MAG: hypothetical protein CV087_24330 [Candidatus Brocadia sp. WS118]|nr:MAG: hypothetical protein CV087_24330 [Candidatus Brocadia sp. WS118]
MKLLNRGITTLFLLSCPILADDTTATVDTSSISTWTTVSKSDTMDGTLEIFNAALGNLEFTIGLIAEKTYSDVHLKQVSPSGWYAGKLGLSGHFLVLKHQADYQSGQLVLYGTGKIKFFGANMLIRFDYSRIDDSRVFGTVTISVNKHFPMLDKLIERDVRRTLSYMQIVGKNLLEDRMLHHTLCQPHGANREKPGLSEGVIPSSAFGIKPPVAPAN